MRVVNNEEDDLYYQRSGKEGRESECEVVNPFNSQNQFNTPHRERGKGSFMKKKVKRANKKSHQH